MHVVTGLEALPEYMHEGVCGYIRHGHQVGGFLTALFSNDLMEAVTRADDCNCACMLNWARFVYNEMPSDSWGSPEKVRAWQERGGLEGSA